MDDLEAWFNENYPKSEQPDIDFDHEYKDGIESESESEDEDNGPEDIPDTGDDDGEGLGEDFEDSTDALSQLQEELDQVKSELQMARDTADILARTVETMTEMVKHYQDASPLLYKLLTDLELDEYRATDYELMILPGTIQTERNDMAMEWIIKRVYNHGNIS